MNKLVLLLFIILCWSCSKDTGTEKYQNKRDNIVNVRDKVKEIDTEETPLSSFAIPYILGNYLIISDYKSYDKLIYIFDKNNFNYIASTADRGQGPGEIASIGYIETIESERLFYVTDHGNQRIFSFDLDSVLTNPNYLPKEKLIMNENLFPRYYHYINDTLSFGQFIEPIGNNNYKPIVGKWNMNTGEIKKMDATSHPEIEKKRTDFAVSMEYGIYVECYRHHDLMSIGTINGDLKYNIYGKKWDTQKSNKYSYYGDVIFCNDKIVALYNAGGDNFTTKSTGEITGTYPTKFIIFNMNGDYIKTLETGYKISYFCYDKENNRLIMSLNDDIQFAYLDLEGII